MWKTTNDLLGDIHGTLKALRGGGDIEIAHAECRLYNAAAKVISIAAEHARLTNRLEGDVIPAAVFGESPEPKALPKAKGKKAA